MLTPEVNIPENALLVALANLAEGFAELLKEETATLSTEWAEAAGIEAPNIFMRDKVAEILSAQFAGFIEKAAPRPHQFTAEHVTAYKTPLLPPPSSKDPIPNE